MPQTDQAHHSQQAQVKWQRSTSPLRIDREKKIIAYPSRQRHMPTSPEFRGISRMTRLAEIFRQTYAEEPGCSDGHVRVRRKIKIDLELKRNRQKPSIHRR